MVLQTCKNLFHQTQKGFVKKRSKRKKIKKEKEKKKVVSVNIMRS